MEKTDYEFSSPRYVSGRYRPWLWLIRLLRKFTPISPGLWIINFFFQRILDINGDVPWMVHFTSRVKGNIGIGKDVWKSFAISGGCFIQGTNGIIIGDNTIFAPNISIVSANHSSENLKEWTSGSPIVIGKNCWIGTGSVILPGVTLGDNVIVGAGSVVTKSFSDDVVIAGNPAGIINQRTVRKAEIAP